MIAFYKGLKVEVIDPDRGLVKLADHCFALVKVSDLQFLEPKNVIKSENSPKSGGFGVESVDRKRRRGRGSGSVVGAGHYDLES
jgi:hypothetical protein